MHRGFQDRARRKGRNLAFAQGSQSLSRAFSGVRDSAAASKACAQLKRQQIACLAIQN